VIFVICNLCACVCARASFCNFYCVYSLVCLCVCLFVGVILWICVAVHVDSPVLLDLAPDTRQCNAGGASGVMCRVLSLVAACYS
jgi:hypothetical protein